MQIKGWILCHIIISLKFRESFLLLSEVVVSTSSSYADNHQSEEAQLCVKPPHCAQCICKKVTEH